MQIFILDEDPVKSASYLCDKHVCGMPKEAAQILSTANLIHGGLAPYKKYSPNHPCNLWASETSANWLWLQTYGLAMCHEYTKRYYKRHRCQSMIEDMVCAVPEGRLTPFAQVVPESYLRSSTVEAYRLFYYFEKAYFAKWKYTEAPSWWASMESFKLTAD